ncbi:MAG: hypothetical protein Q4A28_09970 [Brachymonas sp.]|nr:hypothetical protein [Brachymonas sp.]
MQEKEEKLRALLLAIHIRSEQIDDRAEGADRLDLGPGKDVTGINHNECRRLFSILKELGLVEGDLMGSVLFADPNFLRLSSARLTPKGTKTLKENLQILPPRQPTAATAQIINISRVHHPEEKAEAQSRLRRFLAHPLVAALAAAALGGFLTYLLK